MRRIKNVLTSEDIRVRLAWSTLIFVSVFLISTVISYFLLPDGFLKSKNPFQNWTGSQSWVILALQIFLYNIISVVFIIFASLFSKKNPADKTFLSLGYTVLLVLMCMNGITLGTWSFSVDSIAPPLLERIVGVFDIFHRAALWEMIGQIFIASALAHIALVRINGSDVETKRVKDVAFTRNTIVVFCCGLALMLIGACVESYAILR